MLFFFALSNFGKGIHPSMIHPFYLVSSKLQTLPLGAHLLSDFNPYMFPGDISPSDTYTRIAGIRSAICSETTWENHPASVPLATINNYISEGMDERGNAACRS